MFHPSLLIAVTGWIIDQVFLLPVCFTTTEAMGGGREGAAAAAAAAPAAGMENRKWTSLTQEWDWRRKHDHDEENVKSTRVGNQILVFTQEKDELSCPSWIWGIRKVRRSVYLHWRFLTARLTLLCVWENRDVWLCFTIQGHPSIHPPIAVTSCFVSSQVDFTSLLPNRC